MLLVAVKLGLQRRETSDDGRPEFLAFLLTDGGVGTRHISCQTEPHDQRDREGPWPQSPLLPSAKHQWCKRRTVELAAARNERPHSFGSVNLVRRHTDKVDAPILQGITCLAIPLRCVNVQK